MTEKLTIMIVDDDLDIRNLIHNSLPDEEYEFVHADSGAQAIELLDKIQPDLIFLDLIIPGIDGFDTCRQIRKLRAGKQVPVIIMTSLDDMESIELAYEAGATDFIIKPFNPTLLSYQIRFLLKAKHTTDELQNTQKRLGTAQRIAKLGHWEWTFNDNKITWSDEVCQIMGFPVSKTSASFPSVIDRLHPEDKTRVKNTIKNAILKKSAYNLQHRLVLPDGTIRAVLQEAEIFTHKNGHPEKIVGTLQDITTLKITEDRIKTLAFYNKVTGLPNRALLRRILNKYIRKADTKDPVVLTIALDRFKLITDSYGHAFGEKLIRKVAIRLIRSIKGSSYFSHNLDGKACISRNLQKPLSIAHSDSHEFIVVLPGIPEIEDLALIARSIIDSISEACVISGQEIRVSASVGISLYPKDGKNTDALLKNSATALYHARRQGGNSYKFYTTSMNSSAFERITLETSLRKAIDESQFVLHYQPKMSLTNQRLAGMEALLRWNHPQLGLISPGEFINIIEQTGLIIPLGDRIIASVCLQIKQWRDKGYRPVPVAINLSPVQLRQNEFHQRFFQTLSHYGVKPEMIELEITESALMQNMGKAITMLKKLRTLGTQIAIDDFGTGYSSLTYLKNFPINTLKIDQSFIRNVTADPDDAAIVKGVVALAHSMKLNVVAEGIEDQSQLTFLKNTGCNYGQGYHYCKPVNANTFTNLFMKKNEQATKIPHII